MSPLGSSGQDICSNEHVSLESREPYTETAYMANRASRTTSKTCIFRGYEVQDTETVDAWDQDFAELIQMDDSNILI